ncbi:MAG: leucyl aminopeptidase [Actinomycetota bacterium]|nr:leucyl aminopeptidase [Actinomycetota bacterium]
MLVHVEATSASPLDTGADTIVVGVFEDEHGVAHDVPGGTLAALLESGEARRELERLAVAHAEGRRFIVAGLGAREQFGAERARIVAALAHGRAQELGARTLCWEVPHHCDDAIVAGLVQGTLLHAYRFTRYKPELAEPAEPAGSAQCGPEQHEVESLILSAHADFSDAVRRAVIVTTAQNRARDLGNTPGNELTPAALATYAQMLAAGRDGAGGRDGLAVGRDEPGGRDGLVVTVLDEDEIRDRGMGAFAAVAKGSLQGARLIELRYDGAGSGAPRMALVGKAVTFDSGGLSIKPAAKMQEMKFDMCGGAAVIEAIVALAELRAPINVLGVVGATENLPSGNAVKPGDIVKALDGTTIEVNNTDAEGRLVLADCISYARREGCERIVDLATLTGGIVVALGSTYAGLMSNDDAWAERVETCGASTGELVWRLPLHRDYAEMVKGRYAQLSNVTEDRAASSITAAEFLHHFAGDTPWVHLDIAGTAYDVERAYFDKGGTGFGVRLLVELARDGFVSRRG